ncbi:MAG: hypothetical protein ACPLTR_10040 [Thermacetogeniaceae bacterium]
MRRSKKAVALLLALCLVLAFAVPALADSAQTAPAGNSPKLPAIFQSFLEKLAANLGVEQSKLVDAVKQTAKQLVDEAVQQGKLKSDQAQKIKERIDQGKLFPIAHLLRPERKEGKGRAQGETAGRAGPGLGDER